MTGTKPGNIDDYIATFPKETQTILEQVRTTIKNAAPDAEETISYGIPTFKLNKTYLVYFAGFKNHIGFYPAPVAVDAFSKEFAGYKTGKGSIQFPLDKPMPFDLITRIVAYRVKENSEQAKTKKKH